MILAWLTMPEQEERSRQGRSMRWAKKHGILSCKSSRHASPSAMPPSLIDVLSCRRVNSRTVFLGCKYAIAQFLLQAPHPSGHRGWIINTASMLGLVGLKPSAGAYCASKGAVVLLTKQIAVEYGIDKIHCNALCPGCKRHPFLMLLWLRIHREGMTNSD